MKICTTAGRRTPSYPVYIDIALLTPDMRERIGRGEDLSTEERAPVIESRDQPSPQHRLIGRLSAPGFPSVWQGPTEYLVNGKPATRDEYDLAVTAMRAATRRHYPIMEPRE